MLISIFLAANQRIISNQWHPNAHALIVATYVWIKRPSLQIRTDENWKVFAVDNKFQNIFSLHTYSHFHSIDKLQSSSKQTILLIKIWNVIHLVYYYMSEFFIEHLNEAIALWNTIG